MKTGVEYMVQLYDWYQELSLGHSQTNEFAFKGTNGQLQQMVERWFLLSHDDIVQRLIPRLVIVFAASFLPAVQGFTQTPELFSPQRFSFSLQISYNVNPWGNYNTATETIVHSVQGNPYFIEPRGFYDRIDGDGAIEAMLSYRILKQFHLSASGAYGSFRAGLEFYSDSTRLPSQFVSPAFHQQLTVRLNSYGVGVHYDVPITDGLVLTAGAEISYYHAQLELQWRHNPWARGPVPEGTGYRLQADLAANAWRGTISVGTHYRLWGPIHLTGSLRYRRATLKNIEGEATFTTMFDRETRFRAELVEAANYFGVKVKEQPSNPAARTYLPELTFLTEPDERARVPASIDLTSFGFTCGIMIRL